MFFLHKIQRKLLIPVCLLILIAIGIFGFKIFFLRFSVLPSPDRDLWLLECRIRFEGMGTPVKASLNLPSEVPGFFLSGTSLTPGFQFQSLERDGRLIPRWQGSPGEGTQTIRYQVRLVPDAALAGNPPELELSAMPYSSEEDAAAKEFLKAADPNNKLKDSALVVKILKQLTNRNLPSVRTLLPENRLGAPFVSRAVYLLVRRGIPARSVEGIFLADGRRRQSPVFLLEVKYGGVLHLFDPVTAKTVRSETFLPLSHDGSPLLEISGVRNPKLYLSVLKTSIGAANLNQLRGNLIRHSWLLDISGFNLPLEEQNVFKHLSLLPLAILVIVLVRNVIGLQTMGTFMPVLIAYAFLETGLKAGIPAFAVIMAAGLAVRAYLSRLNLLLVPRISAVVIIVIILMRMLSVLALTLGITQGGTVTFFPLIIIAWTIERASMIWDEDGASTALKQLFVSLLACLPCYFLMASKTLQYFFFSFPEMNLLVLAVILLIGVYTGYRLTELKRFQPLVKS